MVTACVLKEKVTKILAIIEQLDNENITPIDKDVLLQEVRNLYSDILLINTGLQSVETECQEDRHVEPENKPEPVVEEAPAEEEQVVSVSFDDKEFDYSDLLGIGAKVAEDVKETIVEPEPMAEEIQQTEEPVAEDVREEEAAAEVEPMEEPLVEETQQEEIVEEKIEEPVVEEIPQKEEIVEEVAEPVVEEVPQVEDVVEEKPVEEPFVEETKTEPVVTEVSEEHVAEEPAEPEMSNQQPEPTRMTLGEQLGQSRQTSLNDRFAAQNTSDLSSKIGLKPITEIKSAIGLGDRYRYIRELFDGNGTLFESTISDLNALTTYEEAEQYVTSKLGWDLESENVVSFMTIVRRKFL